MSFRWFCYCLVKSDFEHFQFVKWQVIKEFIKGCISAFVGDNLSCFWLSIFHSFLLTKNYSASLSLQQNSKTSHFISTTFVFCGVVVNFSRLHRMSFCVDVNDFLWKVDYFRLFMLVGHVVLVFITEKRLLRWDFSVFF